jgi:hypothetical protein
MEEVGRTFGADFYRVVAQAGIPTIPDPFDKDLAALGPVAKATSLPELQKSIVGDLGDVLVAASVYLGFKAADWSVDQVCGLIWDRLRPALKSLVTAGRQCAVAGKGKQPSRVVLSTLYAEDSLLVVLEVTTDARCDPQGVADFAITIQRHALAWHRRTGGTGKVLRYRYVDGQLAQEPEISDLQPEPPQTP